MSTIKKTADYYLGLNYAISVRKLALDEGGGYMATIPELGSKTFVADGDTAGEAISQLEELKGYLIPLLLEKGETLPEPEERRFSVDQYSGNLMLRIPRSLHAQIAADAARNGCSINKLVTQYLAECIARRSLAEEAGTMAREVVTKDARSVSAAV